MEIMIGALIGLVVTLVVEFIALWYFVLKD